MSFPKEEWFSRSEMLRQEAKPKTPDNGFLPPALEQSTRLPGCRGSSGGNEKHLPSSSFSL